MINIDKTQACLEFGTGDIGITSGCIKSRSGEKVGVVAFSNQSPREIGALGDVKPGQECNLGDFPVTMCFHKKESIDVVIQALLNAKEHID